MPLKFGTSGIRGLVTELTEDEVYLFTTAFLKHAQSLGQTSAVMVARDLRQSSPAIQDSVIKAINDYGRDTLICGKIPTPCLAHYALQEKKLSIMITGSHIPADRNGIKFYLETGETLKDDDQAIYKIYEDLKSSGGLKIKNLPGHNSDRTEEALNSYLHRYLDFFPSGSLADLKLLFYEHSTVARDIFPTILEKLGADVIRVGRSDIFIPVDTEAVDSVAIFKSWIQKHKADALISTDGDGDRPLIVDNLGEVVQGDKLGMITSLFLSIDAVALPISCNSGISQIPQFKEIVFTKIGSPYVVDALNTLSEKHQKVAGFEANGGYILKSTIVNKDGKILLSLPTRDSVLPAISVLLAAKNNNKTLADHIKSLPSRYTSSLLIMNCPTEQSTNLLKEILASPTNFLNALSFANGVTPENINTLDGVRITLQNEDILHFRPSGNAPEFRCYIESNSTQRADSLAKMMKTDLEKIFDTNRK